MNIAFFDSGMGGLTVLNEAFRLMPGENYIYYGDSLNAPYGTKSKEEIRALVLRAAEFLAAKGLKALVLACNTATSVVVNELRATYDFPVIGMEPAVKLALKDNSSRDVLVCATDLTLKEEKLRKLVSDLDASSRIQYLSLQELVMYAERFEFSDPRVMECLEKKLSGYDWSTFDSIVLGCTHFLYFKNAIRSFVPARVQILDGNLGTVRNLESRIIKAAPGTMPADVLYYISGKERESSYFEKYLSYLNTENAKVGI